MSVRSTARAWWRRLSCALAICGGLFLLFPIYLMFVFATHTDQSITTVPAPIWFGPAFGGNLRELLTRLPFFWHNVWMSLRVAAATALLQVLLCSIAGYAFAMLHFKGKDVLFALLLSTLLLPGFLGMIPHRMLIDWLGWHDRAHGLIIPCAASALGIFFMRQYIGKAISRELIEAARLDGCSTTGVYWRIVLPIVSPALAALALIAFIGSWNDVVTPMMTMHDMSVYTAPLALRSLIGVGHWPLGPVFAGSAVVMLPVLVVFAICARWLFRSLVIDSNAGL
jgi:multiple sugar transport system permease protein